MRRPHTRHLEGGVRYGDVGSMLFGWTAEKCKMRQCATYLHWRSRERTQDPLLGEGQHTNLPRAPSPSPPRRPTDKSMR